MAERGNTALRWLDSRLGPVFLKSLSAVLPRRGLPDMPKRVGVICFGALGDLLLLSAVLADLRADHPGVQFLLIGSNTNRSLAPLLGEDDFVTLPVARPDKALAQLRALRLDLILDSSQWPRLPAVLSALSGAPAIGFRTAGQSRHHAYALTVDHRNDCHEIENFRRLAAALPGARPRPAGAMPRLPALTVTAQARARVAELGLGRFVVFHAWPSGTQSGLKEWPLASWKKVAAYLGGRGIPVVLTGAPVDVEASAGLAATLAPVATVVDLAGKLRLIETAALLEVAACTVSVNTGIMHMAATFDVPLVALHGPTNPLRWGPLSDRAYNHAPQGIGCGYLNLGFEYPANPPACMEAIAPEAVIASVEAALAGEPAE